MEAIRVERRDGLVTLTLDRPEKKNAVNAAMWSELDRALVEVAKDPNDRALILTGAGGNFSAGADLSGNPSGKGLTGGPLQPIVQEMRIVGEIVLRLQRIPKPTLAVVDGVAVMRVNATAAPGLAPSRSSLPNQRSRRSSPTPLGAKRGREKTSASRSGAAITSKAAGRDHSFAAIGLPPRRVVGFEKSRCFRAASQRGLRGRGRAWERGPSG
jgi:hypothetical protein